MKVEKQGAPFGKMTSRFDAALEEAGDRERAARPRLRGVRPGRAACPWCSRSRRRPEGRLRIRRHPAAGSSPLPFHLYQSIVDRSPPEVKVLTTKTSPTVRWPLNPPSATGAMSSWKNQKPTLASPLLAKRSSTERHDLRGRYLVEGRVGVAECRPCRGRSGHPNRWRGSRWCPSTRRCSAGRWSRTMPVVAECAIGVVEDVRPVVATAVVRWRCHRAGRHYLLARPTQWAASPVLRIAVAIDKTKSAAQKNAKLFLLDVRAPIDVPRGDMCASVPRFGVAIALSPRVLG